MDVQLQYVTVPSIVPVILTSVALFLATNGPHNWPALWQELVNPPSDARHAIRKPSPYHFVRLSQAEVNLHRAQLMNYVQIYGIPLNAIQQQPQQHDQADSCGGNSCAFCPNLQTSQTSAIQCDGPQ